MHMFLIIITLQEFFLHVKNHDSVLMKSVKKYNFSNIDLTYAENLNVVYPEILNKIIRQRRDITNSLSYDYDNEIKLIKIGNWTLELYKENNLLIEPSLRLHWIYDNNISFTNITKCDYKNGIVKEMKNSFSAITICGSEISGYFDTGGEMYFIQPLISSSNAHILYKRNRLLLRKKRSYLLDNKTEKQWEYFNLTGDIINFDNENKSEEKSVTDNETSDENQIPANTSRKWYREQLDSEEFGYFYDSAWETNTYSGYKAAQKITSTKRRWLEVAIGVDYSVISFHGRQNVEKYVLSLMNIVNGIFQDSSLDANIQLVVTRLLLYETKKYPMIAKGNATKSLLNVNNWNRRLHASLAPGEPRHDLAFWLTRNDIGGPSGYAPIGGVCDANRSCSLNRDEGLTSAFIIAHEMGHILGLNHDGDRKAGNDCTDEDYQGSIMAPMVTATFNKFQWSECSKKEFKKKVHNMTCLLNSPQGLGEIILNTTLGSTFTMDQQCRMEFGKGYSLCRAFEFTEPCTHLWCGKDKAMVCKTKKGPPVEGTECGLNKWCINEYCQDVDIMRIKKQILYSNPVDGGWSKWSYWGSCSRSCGIGVEFRTRKCNNPEPIHGGKACEGPLEDWKICKRNPCPEPLTDIRAQQCKNLPMLINPKILPENVVTLLPFESEEDNEKCKLICISKETREIYKTNDNLIDGTPCSYDDPNNICVQGKCQMIGCDGVLFSKMIEDDCGVCGGNNTECEHVKSKYRKKLKREESKVARIPRMTRNITIEVNVSILQDTISPVVFIFKDRKKKIHSIIIPNVHVDANIIQGTKFYYEKHDFRHKIWGKGPILSEMLLYLHSPKTERLLNVSVISEYYIQKSLINSTTRFKWVMGGWGPCSSSCGGGRRYKTFACFDKRNNKIAPRRRCSFITKPKLQYEKCNTFSFKWITAAWEPCSATCGSYGIQHREIYCVPHTATFNNTPIHVNRAQIDEPWKIMVNPIKCIGFRPPDKRSCNRIPCQSYWIYGEWAQCSVSCGKGFTIRRSHCPPPANETFFSCGPAPTQQKRICKGHFHRHNIFCKNRKRKSCIKDQTEYCSFPVLVKYCKLRSFRRICCKSCSIYQLKPIIS